MRKSGVSGLVLLLLVAGCGGKNTQGTCKSNCDGGAMPDLSMLPDLTAPLGSTLFKFVINTFTMPDGTEGHAFKYDVDGNGTTENKLGGIIPTIKIETMVDPQAAVDMTLAAGDMLQLLQIRTVDPMLHNDPSIQVGGFVGTTPIGANPALNFSGSAMLDVDLSEEPANHTLDGALAIGKGDTLHLPPGSFPIHLPFAIGQPPVHMTLYAAHASFDTTSPAAGDFRLANGMLNGGLSQDDVNNKLIPAIAQMLQNIVATDPTSANAQNILMIFDRSATGNHDDKVEVSEVQNNSLVMALLGPDLDLFDGQGNFSPNTDGVQESLSIGVGFTAVQAVFPDQQ